METLLCSNCRCIKKLRGYELTSTNGGTEFCFNGGLQSRYMAMAQTCTWSPHCVTLKPYSKPFDSGRC